MEQIKSFIDLHQSEQVNELFSALSKAQSEMDSASKNASNPFFKSKYANLTEMKLASLPALTKNELSVDQQIITHDGETYLVTCLGHSSGQWKRSCVSIRPAKDDIQSFGSAISYIKRYSYGSLIGIVIEEDDDGESNRPRNGNPIKYNKPLPSYGGDIITKEQYEQLLYEIGDNTDIAQRILNTYKIDDLKLLPKPYFMRIIEGIRNNKRTT